MTRGFVVVLAFVGLACSPSGSGSDGSTADRPRADRPGASERPLASAALVDVAKEAGIDFIHETGARGRRHMAETMVGGGGFLDFDGDGFLDLYLVSGNEHSALGGDGSHRNRLYRNLGNGRFEDVTDAAGVGHTGYGCGLAVGDVDNDGDSDLYVANLGPDVLYRNRGDGTFEDVTRAAGIDVPGWSTSAIFVDYDQDGLLDLYVCQYVVYDPRRECRIGRHPSYCSPGEFPGAPDRLYRNLGDGRFEDVSEKAGVAIAGPDAGKSLGVIAFDSEDDGDIDLFVACDQVPNLFFRNDGRGKFREDALIAGLAYSDAGISQAGMGVDAGDIDLDGRQDLVVTNFSDETNAVYLAEPGGRFREASKALGVAGPSLVPLGFGVVLWDFDRDSDLDIYVANGHVQDNIATIRPGMTFAQPDLLLENRDGREFAPVTAASAGAWLERALVGRAVATGDYDNDGDEDLLVVHASGPVALLRNDAAPDARWIAFRLRGTRSNRDGYGAVLRTTFVRAASRSTRVAECRAGRSYTASSDPRVRFGLGRGEVAVERVEIRWPSGIVQTIDRPEIDRVHDVVEPST